MAPLILQVAPSKMGNALVPLRRIDAELIASIKPGKYRVKLTQLRSVRAHNHYFKVIEIAADNWGKQEPDPQGDAKLLRAWLQCKAGPQWRTSLTGPLEALPLVKSTVEAMHADKYVFIDEADYDGRRMCRVHVPISINHDDMGEEKFRPLRQAVYEIIELKFKCTIDELLMHGEAA